LAALEEVFAVHLVTGARDIEILVVLQELEELENFLLRDVAKIRGIGTLSAGIAADVIKYDFDRAQIA
jgi:Lrp/AsnC family transcriptional regulator, leucine-responsive regulatory protein